jgi:hypothetical protein
MRIYELLNEAIDLDWGDGGQRRRQGHRPALGDMQAMNANGDEGYYCFLWGIGYANEAEIVRIINPVCMAA